MPVTVRITIRKTSWLGIPLIWADDRLPPGAEPLQGKTEYRGPWDRELVIEYVIKPLVPGLLRFEGVTLRFGDLAGLFFQRRMLRDAVEYLVLPPLRDDEGNHRGEKRFNTLPPPGAHRLRRPGGGSELLDLREYQPGDPPKTIAWKVSAKRDKLITKEFENDVPIRCTIFLDTSESVRIGPHGGTPLAKLADAAATVAQAATANRDLVGLTTFDESHFQVHTPARTTAHLMRLMRSAAEAAALMPSQPLTDADRLVKASLSLASDVYPELLEKSTNSRPWSMYWRSILDTRLGWFVIAAWLFPIVAIIPPVFNLLISVANSIAPSGWGWLGLLIAILIAPGLGYSMWSLYGLSGLLSSGHRARIRQRKQLGLIFATMDGSGPGTIERTVRDDDFIIDRANRFLIDHHVRMTPTLVDEKGRDRYRAVEKVQTLSTALLRAVARAKDNELFAIFADLARLGSDAEPVLKAIRVARARKHQVLVVMPWPEGLTEDPVGPKTMPPKPSLGAITRFAIQGRYARGFAELRRSLTASGAAVIRMDQEKPVPLILEKLDRLRGVRTRR
jgi:uncharacterized protein (DUF58 family)